MCERYLLIGWFVDSLVRDMGGSALPCSGLSLFVNAWGRRLGFLAGFVLLHFFLAD